MGASEEFLRWDAEARLLASRRERTLAPQERRRLDRQILAAESRAFSALRSIARSVRERGDDAGLFWNALASHGLAAESDASEPEPAEAEASARGVDAAC